MKRIMALAVVLTMLFGSMPASAAPSPAPNSAPIAKGTINKVTYLYWGKSELFPTLTMVGPGQKFDVYEFDKNWVMVLYDTWVSQGVSGGSQSFYCYVKRTDITCDPQITGDESPKADTGPGKRPGRKPKPKPSAEPTQEAETAAPTAEASAEPEPTVEEQEEYDWIIRTPGVCSVTVHVQELDFTCSFALMAQKAGGTAPSSDPTYNHGMHTAYAATAFYGMVAPMQSLLDNTGASQILSGSGGIELTGQASGATFYLDTGAEDPALVNFTVNLQSEYKLNPKVTDGQLTGEYSTGGSMPFPMPVQLKKVGGGYKFVLPGMKPGGGDLTFPAVLEKTFADPDRWDKAAKEADRRRKEADRLMKEMMEKLKKLMQDEYNKKQQDAGKDGQESTKPMTVPGENGEDIPLATLGPLPSLPPLTDDDIPLATLGPLPSLPPLTDDNPPVVPLVPLTSESVDNFPSGK